jgi:hypothetical protein
MLIGRLVGRLCWGLAFLAAGAEIVRSLVAAEWTPLALGEVWFYVDSRILGTASLGLLQAGIQRHVHEALWDPVAITLLLWPAWAYAAVLGALLVYLFRPRGERRLFRRKRA